jgi:hypothetical protein
MSNLKIMSRGGYIAMGIVVALILVPTGIAAATVAYTGIEGTNGSTATVNHAGVTSASQLLTAEASPSSFREYTGLALASGCTVLATVPSGHGFIVRNIEMGPAGYFASEATVKYFTGSTCSGHQIATMVSVAGTGSWSGPQSFPLNPGFGIAAGDSISASVTEDAVNFDTYVQGYLVPSSDIPTTTP